MLLDAWRLAVGTLTVLPVRPPSSVDRRRAGVAILLAPLAILPWGVLLAAVVVAGDKVGLAAPVTALIVLMVLTVGTRALHLDGLSDTIDGLAASYDREVSLRIMKSGTSGPAGTVAVFLVLGLQTVSLSVILSGQRATHAAAIAVAAIVVSRVSLTLCCLRGIPSARAGGLGDPFSGAVPRTAAMLMWLLAGAVMVGISDWVGFPWWRGLVAIAVVVGIVALFLRHVGRRIGGVTGDVYGACIEIAFAATLVALS